MAGPNILLLVTDQQRFDALGVLSDWVGTPHIDRLAREGVTFTRTYTNSPACVPARVSLATGRYPHHTGVWANRPPTLPPDTPTWMRAVRDAGYATSVFGKTHLHPHVGDLREREWLLQALGMDVVDEIGGPRAMMAVRCRLTDLWEEQGLLDAYRLDLRDRIKNVPWEVRPSPLPLELYPDVYVSAQAQQHLRGYDGDRPWFCWVGFSGPHEPWDAPGHYAEMFDPADMPPPLEAEPESGDRPRGKLDHKRRIDFEPGAVARLRADYAASLRLIDDEIGKILSVVEERGELADTVVAVVSDHGEMNGDFGMLFKQNFLDPAARVPFVLRLPDGPQGLRIDQPVELMDLGASLVEVAGGTQPAGSHARSVLPLIARKGSRHREVVLSEYSGEMMIADAEWKMAVNRSGGTYLLYHLAEDPFETRNLAGDPTYAGKVAELRSDMLRTYVRAAE